jgi:hypothetical protein
MWYDQSRDMRPEPCSSIGVMVYYRSRDLHRSCDVRLESGCIMGNI